MDELKFGIEIIAAMKASAYNTDIEEGRILVLQETEIDRMEGVTPEYWNDLPLVDRQRFTKIAKHEKERLHTQARYVAGMAIEYLKSEGQKVEQSSERERLIAFSDWMFLNHYHEPPTREIIDEYLSD